MIPGRYDAPLTLPWDEERVDPDDFDEGGAEYYEEIDEDEE